jgi:hypothetical protein
MRPSLVNAPGRWVKTPLTFFWHVSLLYPVVSFNSTAVMALDSRPPSSPEFHTSDDLVRGMQTYVDGREIRARRIQNQHKTETCRHDQHRGR